MKLKTIQDMEFNPVTFNITVETFDELKLLRALFNSSTSSVISQMGTCGFVMHDVAQAKADALFDMVEEEINKVKDK